MARKQKQLELEKNKYSAVRTIEKFRIKQLQRRELRRVRLFLRQYPFECRAIYFKFMDVKKNTNQLINEFTQYLVDSH